MLIQCLRGQKAIRSSKLQQNFAEFLNMNDLRNEEHK